jgi:hypothetical protein
LATIATDGTVYGFGVPTLAGAADMFSRVYGPGSDVWDNLLRRAGGIHAPDAVGRLAQVALDHTDPVVALCGRALAIELETATRLGAVRAILAAAP